MPTRPARCATSLSVALALLLSVGAQAQGVPAYTEPMPGAASPQASATIEPSVDPVPFQLSAFATQAPLEVVVEVSSRSVLGQDGTLADDYVTDTFHLFESDAQPGIYRGSSNAAPGWWTDTAGTYYWQAHALYTGDPAGLHWYSTPVYSITVRQTDSRVATTTAPVSRTEALSAARTYARNRLKARRGLVIRCSRRSQFRFSCRARWRVGGITRHRTIAVRVKGDEIYTTGA